MGCLRKPHRRCNCWRRRVLSVMLIWIDAWHLAPLLRSMKHWVRRVLHRLLRYQRQLSRAGRLMRKRGKRRHTELAYELVRERAFDDAVLAFTGFLADYPFGRYAPNAHYWLGELYLVLDPPDPELARQNFKLLLDQYPADPKVPDALYKLGRVQFIKGNRQRSREYLDEVIREYPSHAAAQLARQFLLENF